MFQDRRERNCLNIAAPCRKTEIKALCPNSKVIANRFRLCGELRLVNNDMMNITQFPADSDEPHFKI